MMRHDKLCTKRIRLFHDGICRVQSQQYTMHFPLRTADLKAGVVKIHLKLKRCNTAKRRKNIPNGSHFCSLISDN